MAGITSTGLGSGININSLVSQLVDAEKKPITSRLDSQELQAQAKISSLGNVKSALSAFRDSLSGLKLLSNFQKLNATSSDTTFLTATADSNADLANYQIEVKRLAQAHALVSPVFAGATDTVGTGTLTIKFGKTDYDAGTDTYNGFAQNGDKGALTVTVDSTNNTLTGLRDAINKANAGVTAAIVNDGSGYRLVLNSTESGEKNSLQISVSDSDGNDTNTSGLSRLAFNASATNMTQTQTALDAKVAINGLDVLSSSNTISTALKGITLNLQQAQAGKLVSLNVTQSSGDITKSVEGFVKSFNDLVNSVNSVASYDAAKKSGGILQGDASVNGAMSQLRFELGSSIKGLKGSVKSLADIGIKTQSDGTLALNSEKLNAALASNKDGVTALFAVLGRPSDAGILYTGGTMDTKAGEYAVNITQTATQGVLNGGTVNSLVVDANNDTFRIKVDGVASGDISLTRATYSNGSELATEIQSRINGDSALKAKGVSVNVAYDSSNSRFVLTSKSYGSASQVEITAVDANFQSTLGLGVAAGTAGLDVAGTIGGLAAEGKGKELTVSADGDAKGLSLLISDGVTGDRGTVDFSRGLMERLGKVLSGLLDSGGSITARTAGLQKDLEKINDERQKLDDRMSRVEQRLLLRFNAMDAVLARFQATSTYLTQQLSALPLSNSNKSQ
jgi:flagellar hook-associated protein 2